MKIRLLVWTLLGVMCGTLVKIAFGASVESVIATSEPKVVKIGIVGEKGGGVCSGAFISSTGIVLTCAHCFAHTPIKKIFIKTSDQRVFPAAIWALDNDRDLALVVPDSLGPFPYFKLGLEPVRGQEVVSMGSPLGIQSTAEVGHVANLIKQAKIIIHSAFISPGNSGGPLIDLKGRLIGINEAMISYGFLQTAHGLYVAINVISIKEFLRDKAAR